MSWEPQIRTNLDAAVYRQELDTLLAGVPGASVGALINTRFSEACVRLPGGKSGQDDERRTLLALTLGLFGDTHVEAADLADALGTLGAVDAAYLCFRQETVLLSRIAGNRLMVLTVSASLNQGACGTLLNSLTEQAAGDGRAFETLVQPTSDVLAAALIDLSTGALLDVYERAGDLGALAFDESLAQVLTALVAGSDDPPGLRLHYRDGELVEILRAELVTPSGSVHWARVPFDPEHLLVLRVDPTTLRGLVWTMMRRHGIEVLRIWVDGLLEYGIPSTMSPFPETQKEFLEIVDELRQLPENDLLGRLDVGGFANYTIGEGIEMQRCQECIYYLPHARWCDLPELPVPVEPHWWCRLWKI